MRGVIELEVKGENVNARNSDGLLVPAIELAKRRREAAGGPRPNPLTPEQGSPADPGRRRAGVASRRRSGRGSSRPNSLPTSHKIARRKARPGDLSLRAYRAKRDFAQTSEPPPEARAPASGETKRMFVIQKHAASHLHYDFRLEMGGVLKSWAVPKGVPYERSEKRLAMQVEDHPMDYARFEGTIPPGNYGAGTVMVWDIGTFEVADGNLGAGKLHLRLHGKKLEGEWILVQARGQDGDQRTWFLIKGGTSMKRLSVRRDDSSALTGRSLRQIAAANDAQWISNRPSAHPKANSAAPVAGPFTELLKPLPQSPASFVEPMHPKLVTALPEGDAWIYEVKFDGYRALAIRSASKAQLRSRHKKTLDYPHIRKAIEQLPARSLVLDGEVIAVGSDGKPSFQALHRGANAQTKKISYYVFDILHYEGKDLRSLGLEDRKRLLAHLAQHFTHPLHFSAALKATTTTALLKAVRDQGLEGIVAKKRVSRYESGERSGAWLKLRTDCQQEFVIGGYRTRRGHRDFDALLVGYYEGHRLIYAGKVKNGFTPRMREQVLDAAKALHRRRPPFAELPIGTRGGWGEGLTEEDLDQIVWLRPKLVARIGFVEWTPHNHLRHSSFRGLRDDKDAGEVRKEVAS
ncbi:MAG: non-homologous end-joining DNA ligase [Verrucomicrobiota bacterium]